MNELSFIFEQVVDSFISEHHFIIKGHKLVLHVSLNSMYEPDTVIKQGVK